MYNFYLLCVVCLTKCTLSYSEFRAQSLFQDLFKSYNPEVFPGNLTVDYGLSMICPSLNEKTGELESIVWERMAWRDRRLTWDPSLYDEEFVIRAPPSRIWMPDITLYNSNDVKVEGSDFNAFIYSDGTVNYIPKKKYRTNCKQMHSGEWQCHYSIGSWTYDGLQIHLGLYGMLDHIYDNDIDPLCDVMTKSSMNVNITIYPCCNEPYPKIEADFVIKKR